MGIRFDRPGRETLDVGIRFDRPDRETLAVGIRFDRQGRGGGMRWSGKVVRVE